MAAQGIINEAFESDGNAEIKPNNFATTNNGCRKSSVTSTGVTKACFTNIIHSHNANDVTGNAGDTDSTIIHATSDMTGYNDNCNAQTNHDHERNDKVHTSKNLDEISDTYEAETVANGHVEDISETDLGEPTSALNKRTFTDNNNTVSVPNNVDNENSSVLEVFDQNSAGGTPRMQYRFKGPTFSSFREPNERSTWKKYSNWDDFGVSDGLKESTPALNRSQYSLVSCGELTPEAVQLWLSLPEEVKYDETLSAFRQRYEKEHGKEQRSRGHQKRLPQVNSAPHLNNNHLHIRGGEDLAFISTNGKIKEEKENVDAENGLENICSVSSKKSRVALASHFVKMTLLLACWIFFTVAFLMFNEKEEIVRNCAVGADGATNYVLNTSANDLSVFLKLSGPFLSENAEEMLTEREKMKSSKMEVWLERWIYAPGSDRVEEKELSTPWAILLQKDELNFNRGEERTTRLQLSSNMTAGNRTSVFAISILAMTNQTTPFTMSYDLDPLDTKSGVLYACALLFGLYVLIIFEIINRTMAAILISTTALAVLALTGQRPSLEEVVSWLDMETLLLLFSMMLLVAIMAETGMFDFLAVFTFEVTKGKLWPLITLLCAITAVLSTCLDNVTTVLLMTPVTIRLCEVMNLDPVPILMSMVLFSNIGGTATPVGDPPNVIIASNKEIVQAGINFTNFSLHMTLGILLVCVQTYIQLRYVYRDASKLRQNVPRDIQDLRHQISIWRRAADSLPHLSKDQLIVKERLERKVKKLTAQLEIMVKESNKRAIPKENFHSTLADLKEKYKIRDKWLLVKASFALSFVVTVFFLHSIPELNRVSLGWTALLGALLLLLLADREDLEPILHRVEWSTLLFFAALFVLMEALTKLGLIQFIGGLTESLILSVDESARLGVALILMLWVSGVCSAFVDNIPLTTMMVRIVTSLGNNPALGLPLQPLVWALVFGACLGGNGTLIGASANVVCAGVAEQHGYKITFVKFFKLGFPMMVGHLIVASGYLLFCHVLFQWH